MILHLNHKKITSWLGAGFLGLLVALVAVAPHAQSQSGSTPITGWLWSDNIGWVSLNCSTDPTGCSGAAGDWGLSLNGSNVSGYAWSDNIGWISAEDADVSSCGADPQFSSNSFTGWLKAVSADDNGWDGCISLSGASPAYAVDTDTNASYLPQTSGAWGSDVVGWLGAGITASCTPAFQCVSGGSQNSCTGEITSCPNGCDSASSGQCNPDVTVDACLSVGTNPTPPECTGEVSSGRVDSVTGTATVYWDAVPATLDCTLTNTKTGATEGSGVSSQYTTPKLTTGTLSYTLTCTRSGSTVVTKQVTVGLLPVYQER